MRRWIVPALVFVVALAAVYVFIPNNQTLKEEIRIAANSKAVARNLLDEKTWQRWWPQAQETTGASDAFSFGGKTFRIAEKKLSSFVIDISNGEDTLKTEMLVVPAHPDTLQVFWVGAMPAGANPVRRLKKNSWVNSVETDIELLLQKLKDFYSNEKNLYRFDIREVAVTDSTLISTFTTGTAYPTTATIYQLIDKLRAYAERNGAIASGFPMLNITPDPDQGYLTRVALPVNKVLPGEGDISYRRMLGGGNILVTEVKGGPRQIEKAFGVLQEYMSEHKRIHPAIPFQSLVTDRRQQPDTTQWVTKIFWPVM